LKLFHGYIQREAAFLWFDDRWPKPEIPTEPNDRRLAIIAFFCLGYSVYILEPLALSGVKLQSQAWPERIFLVDTGSDGFD
jgi:hypothetical protein